MQFMPDDKLHGPRKKFSTLSCMLSPASLIRVIYSFGWHRTSLPVIVSSGFKLLMAFGAFQTILSVSGAYTVQNLSVPRPQSSSFQIPLFYSSAVHFLSKVTELPISGLNNQYHSGTLNLLTLSATKLSTTSLAHTEVSLSSDPGLKHS